MGRKRRAVKSKKSTKTTNNKFKDAKTQKTSQIVNENNNIVTEKPEIETEIPQNQEAAKRPIVAPNGKTFYPCQFCAKIFAKETTCKSHMVKCSDKNCIDKVTEIKIETIIAAPKLEDNIAAPKLEETIAAPKLEKTNEGKEPTVDFNAKEFFPCEHCTKIFLNKSTCESHSHRCETKLKRNEKNTPEKKPISKPQASKELKIPSEENIKTLKAPSGKLYYPCQYCIKIFAKEITFMNHMEKCDKRKSDAQTINSEISKPPPSIKITQNVIIKPATSMFDNSNEIEDDNDDDDDMEVQLIKEETPKYDLSIYDYDEDTTEEVKIKNCKCKLCPFIAENPIELLKHKRIKHTVPKKLVSHTEITKYFDHPDRSYCPICEKPLKTRNYKSIYLKHLLVHTVGLFHECRICKKRFRRSDHLRAHEKRHVITYAEMQAIKDASYEDEGLS